MKEDLEYPVRLLLDREGEKDPKAAVRKCVSRLLAKHNIDLSDNRPIDIEQIAKKSGIEIIAVPERKGIHKQGKTSTSISPTPKSFRIHSLGHLSKARLRASIAHEIGHTFFYDRSAGMPSRPLGLPPGTQEEDLCEYAAREILLPIDGFIKEWTSLRDYPNLANCILNIANRFEVSPYLAAQRLLNDWPAGIKNEPIRAAGLWSEVNAGSSNACQIIERFSPQWLIVANSEKISTIRIAFQREAKSMSTFRVARRKASLLSTANYGMETVQILGVLRRRK